ncbi:fungal specific transcription factor domain-containing protein [Colletotrichum tofieldiae]|uniref:Fungal specific transcription factor domain-containing protein n=1 Tax=Colletotrichum tofieldiae TaxID=708197 RepID=A0A166SIH8_9PEZI|nr:fungal specific transcription factor domain-containing protein [Colletotrichum tofieldiae]
MHLPSRTHSQTQTEPLLLLVAILRFQAGPLSKQFEKLVSKLPYSKDGETAVASLRAAVDPVVKGVQDPQAAALGSDFTGMPLPPRQLVIKSLGHCKKKTTRFFRDYPFVSVVAFTEMCQQVYFPTEECSLSTFIIVNSGLCNIFRDFDDDAIRDMDIEATVVAHSISTCAANVRRAVVCLRLTLDPTFENIVALLLSVQFPAHPPVIPC